jgi:hypothetical protein
MMTDLADVCRVEVASTSGCSMPVIERSPSTTQSIEQLGPLVPPGLRGDYARSGQHAGTTDPTW